MTNHSEDLREKIDKLLLPAWEALEVESRESRLDGVADAILSTIIDSLPGKRPGVQVYNEGTDTETYSCSLCGGYDECDCAGYNEAIDDFTAIFEKARER